MRALINTSYKNAGVHNVHEPETARERYRPILSSFRSFSLDLFPPIHLSPCLRPSPLPRVRSADPSPPGLAFHRVTRNTMDK